MENVTLLEMKEIETKKNVTGGSGKSEPPCSPLVTKLFAKPPAYTVRNSPTRFEPSSAPATLHMVRLAMNEVMREWEGRIETKTQYCEEAKTVVAKTLEDVKLYRPEEVAVLVAENARHLAEIKNLQFAIHLSRKTNRELGVQGAAGFWRRFGSDLVRDASLVQQTCQEASEYISRMSFEGRELLSNLLNNIDGMARTLEEYGENAQSYAHDHEVPEIKEERINHV